ncbi:MAG: hypothetical protein RIC53_16725 [Cyclobacteriaceae bacterium]
MSAYNGLERAIAKGLENFPWLRDLIRHSYKRIIYLAYRKHSFRYEMEGQLSLKTPYQLVGQEPPKEENLFFGYYDKSPWNPSMTKLIYHSYIRKTQRFVDIKCFDLVENKVRIVGRTETWNFQQGAMAQWIDDSTIIFNSIVEGNQLGAISLNLDNGDQTEIPLPVQSLHPNGNKFISLNYKRLMLLRPDYGYSQTVENFSVDMDYAKDGLWELNLSDSSFSLILTIDELIINKPVETMKKSKHKFNHVMYSPDGEKIVFMHRWLGAQGKFSRLYVYDFLSQKFKLLLDDRMISHYSWVNNRELVTWARYDEEDDYYVINVDSDEVRSLGNNYRVFGDGHPSASKQNEKLIISDSYPDKGRIRTLFVMSEGRDELEVLGRFHSPWSFEGTARCDLHPRWSPDGKLISIDSAHSGTRGTYLVEGLEV